MIHVASDNMSALSMITKLQTHSPVLGVVARELALDVSDAAYEPQTAAHVPGVANVAADTLSRKYEPGVAFTLPAVLAGCTEVHPPARNGDWWRSLAPRHSHKAVKVRRQRPTSARAQGPGHQAARKRHRTHG